MKNVLKPLGKSALIPLGLTASALARDSAIQKKMFGSGMTAMIISIEEMNDIMKANYFRKFAYFKKALAKQLKLKQTNKKADFLVSC